MFEWAYDGVNASIPRNAGPECAYYMSPKRRIIETSFISIIIITLLVWGYKRIRVPAQLSYANHDRAGRRVLLILMSLVLGMEIGFKFTSRTIVYLLNPCHITTAVQKKLNALGRKKIEDNKRIEKDSMSFQSILTLSKVGPSAFPVMLSLFLYVYDYIYSLIPLWKQMTTVSVTGLYEFGVNLAQIWQEMVIWLYLLAADPSPRVTAIFRIHLNFLNGPLLAYLFPETESRKIFADKALYYIQHGLMVVIPYYLLRIGGVYNVEPLSDLSWSIFSYGLNLVYHFWILQPTAFPIQVNLSHMLCAAVLDPFDGQYYRVWTLVHQGLLCPLLCKLFCYTSDFFLTKFPPTRVKPTLGSVLPKESSKYENSEKLNDGKNTSGNGHTHVN